MSFDSIKPPAWLAATLLLAISLLGFYAAQTNDLRLYIITNLVHALIYAGAATLLLIGRFHVSSGAQSALKLILGLAFLLRIGLLFAPPISTDIYRYVWDGTVQLAGINPYRYVPGDPALAALRDAAIFPNINRADYAHTIYPPAAQLMFLLGTVLGHSLLSMKALMLALEGLAIFSMLGLLKRRGLPQTRILLYVWHPLPLWEFAGSGHVDAAAIAALWLAFLLVEGRQHWTAGIALAAGTLIKYYPALMAPAIWRRWDWKLPLAFIATIALLYLPYLSAGPTVFGFLSGYVHEEGLATGQGFFLWAVLTQWIKMPLADVYYLTVCGAILIVAGLCIVIRKQLSQAAIRPAAALALAFTVMLSPHQAWYFAWLVPFLCFEFSLATLYLTCTAVLLYMIGWDDLKSTAIVYAPFFVLLLVESIFRREPVISEG